MRRIAFLTIEDRTGYVIDDALAIAALEQAGIAVTEVPWSLSSLNLTAFEAVIVRTTWDYQHDLPRFLRVLEDIAASGVRLANNLELIRWNATKTYLRDLAAKGVPIVPTQWGTGLTAAELRRLPERVGCDEIIVKPVVGANAGDTYRVRATMDDTALQAIAGRYLGRAWMAQPFLRSIVDEGEMSLFYFAGELSHAVRKSPKAGDFRVQEEHGGLIVATPASDRLLDAGRQVMAALGEAPLQARVDLVTLADGSLALMEVELIEPSLYFRTDPDSPAAFARAVQRWLPPRAARPSAR